MSAKLKPPTAEKRPKEITQHGESRIDNYAWMKDKNWQKIVAGDLDFADPEIKEYIDAENAYTEEAMKSTQDLQKEIYDEILSRLKEDDDSVPRKYGNFYYYAKTEKGKEYPILCRKEGGLDGREEIYFDVNKEAEKHKLFKLGAADPSPNNNLLLYSFNLSGSMNYSLKLRDLNSGKDIEWQIDDTTASCAWANDNEHIYYIKRHEVHGRGHQLFRMNINEGPKSTKLIFEKPKHLDELFMGLSKSQSEKYFFLTLNDTSTSESHYFSADDIESQPQVIEAARPNIEYRVEHSGDYFLIKTNFEATNFKIMKAPTSDPAQKNWQEYIPHDPTSTIDSFEVYKDHLVRTLTVNPKAIQTLVVKNIKSGEESTVEMPQSAYYLASMGSDEYDTDSIQFSYQSPSQPTQVIELDLNTSKQKILKTKEVPNYNVGDYEVERVFAPAHDGESIPLTIIYKKGLELNSQAPAFVYAYGSYGYGMPAYFSAARMSLVDRGFVYAIAHIRGGDEKGREWYLNGKMMNKLNTFKDYISCCEYLIEKNYIAKDKVVANGGSAGGMLMGGVTNMRPDLFHTVIADVPFVDVINTISDTTLPLTEPEWNEWGNPIKDESAYKYMMSYSPYDNVEAKEYPNMLYNSGISDEQVTYWEPTKMVAKLRELKTDNNLLLLKIKMHAGHSGASKRYESISETAFDYAFILLNLKMA